jgi:hypothetical protein
MKEEAKAIEELNVAEIEQVSGAGDVTDAIEGFFRTISNAVGGGIVKTGVVGGLRG